jgi:putative lipoprotein
MRLSLVAAAFLSAALSACGGDTSPQPEAPRMAELTGTVAYRERMALRMDAVITVRLSDVSRMDAPSILIAEETIEARGKSVPIPYRLTYDPSRIEERNTYAVRAEIRGADGQLMWTTDTVVPVLTRGAPSDGVDIMLVRTGG